MMESYAAGELTAMRSDPDCGHRESPPGDPTGVLPLPDPARFQTAASTRRPTLRPYIPRSSHPGEP